MNRRTLCNAVGVGIAATTAGCLGGPVADLVDGEPGPFEQCDRVEIEYDSLPSDIQTEVDTALDEEFHETDRLLFAEAVDVGRSFVVVDSTPYEPTVERDNTSQRLTLAAVDTPRLPEPRTLSVRNADDREHELTIKLTGEEPIASETLTLRPDEAESIETTDRFGSYTLRIDSPTEPTVSAEETYRISESYFGGIVERRSDVVAFMQEVADLERCRWA